MKNKGVVFGSHVNALGIIRSLGEKGIRSLDIDKKRGIASWSKYQRFHLLPDPINESDLSLKELIVLGKKENSKGVIFATDDEWLLFLNQHRELLSNYFIFAMSDLSVLQNAFYKDKMYKLAGELKIPIPETYYIRDGINDTMEKIRKISYPFVIKPSSTIKFKDLLDLEGRVIVIRRDEQLDQFIKKLSQCESFQMPLIIQKEISGSAENLYTITAYSNKNGEIIDYVICHKIRQYPPDAGTITSGKVHDISIIYSYTEKILRRLNFWGISNTEFKFDKDDSKYKLMEINCRPGMMNRMSTNIGKNLPYLAYCEALGITTNYGRRSMNHDGKVWIYLKGDLINYFYYRNDRSKRVSINNWLKSISGKKCLAVESIRDPLPAFADWFDIIKKMLNSFKHK